MNEATTLSPLEARAGLRWALVPVFLLTSSVLGVGSMAYVATHDPSFATEPDYYQKAVAWDRTQAQAAENARLGYQISLPGKLALGVDNRASVTLTVRDRAGRVVDGARVRAEAFPNLAADQVRQIELVEHAPGSYEAPLDGTRAGIWIFRVSAELGADHFTAELRSELVHRGSP